jgi:uncharacterized protein YceK
MKYLFIVLALSGCGATQTHYSGTSKPSNTQYVRDVTGRTVYRITDGNIYNTSGTRIARITKK